jgi:hypothetical protein
MLQPHSLLWHYLWLAPHAFQIVLAVFLWRRRLYKVFPVFFAYAIFEALEEFTLYGMDVNPSISGQQWWSAFWIGLIVEGALKLGVIGELFFHLIESRRAIAKVGAFLISGSGAVLILVATIAGAYSRTGHPEYLLISRSHILLQSCYIVECGLLLSLFVFAAYFKLVWNGRDFGIALGFALVFCQHMGAWAVLASGVWVDKNHIVDFLNGLTYHVAVLLWCYYLLVPHKSATTSAVPLPENNLAIWNRELERLLQQ